MLKKLLIGLIISFSLSAGYAQINLFNASTLATTLRENAHSVKREEKINFDVKDIDEARYTVHRVYTVLDAEGEDVLYFAVVLMSFENLRTLK